MKVLRIDITVPDDVPDEDDARTDAVALAVREAVARCLERPDLHEATIRSLVLPTHHAPDGRPPSSLILP